MKNLNNFPRGIKNKRIMYNFAMTLSERGEKFVVCGHEYSPVKDEWCRVSPLCFDSKAEALRAYNHIVRKMRVV